MKTFTDPTDRQQWAVDTAKNGDSTSDVVVLAVATQDEQFGLALSNDFPLDKHRHRHDRHQHPEDTVRQR